VILVIVIRVLCFGVDSSSFKPVIVLCHIDWFMIKYDALVEMCHHSFQYIRPFDCCSRGLLELCSCSTTKLFEVAGLALGPTISVYALNAKFVTALPSNNI